MLNLIYFHLKIYDKMFFRVNYDNSDLSGSHWVAVVKNNQFDYYFDSYGLRPLAEVIDKFLKNNRFFTMIQQFN